MSTRAATYEAVVRRREQLSEHLVRLELGGPGLAGFASTGIPDEWVALVPPGQFQSRYYTVRSWDPEAASLVLDVVVHDVGLVTEWVRTDCAGQICTVSDPKGSFAMPPEATWLMLVGDLTALPAMARIAASAQVPVHAWAEVPDAEELSDYLAPLEGVRWLPQPGDGASNLADAVAGIDWPTGDGYFWMAGESAQMRAIRKHLMRERRLPSTAYDVMGYWRGGTARQPRAVDPGPIWRTGKAAGKTDEQIWADYDEARES
ncbi:siderophore-interacting protein [Nocardioides sp. R-C-SC26]|uniref:siderophore-interacting protein n=1 Tax=Nocardioides sp. R-C-SC26 TaxID=2870414 RepID=UPI001E651D26|nr:siderophore-interacting protein [Nocardioides sp. R-C-SC26]